MVFVIVGVGVGFWYGGVGWEYMGWKCRVGGKWEWEREGGGVGLVVVWFVVGFLWWGFCWNRGCRGGGGGVGYGGGVVGVCGVGGMGGGLVNGDFVF